MSDTLSNGAIVLERARIEEGGNGLQPAEIVLCHLPWNKVTPFVTWRRNINALGGDGGTYWGHYHRYRGDAKRDFNERIGLKNEA